MEIPRKNQKKKKMLEIRSTITGKKDTFGYFDGLVSKLDTAAERISKLEDIINRILKKQREQRLKKENNIKKPWNKYRKFNI